jgi:hypothetical protein
MSIYILTSVLLQGRSSRAISLELLGDKKTFKHIMVFCTKMFKSRFSVSKYYLKTRSDKDTQTDAVCGCMCV